MTKIINAYIITMMNDIQSTKGARVLLKSIEQTGTRVNPLILPATIPSTMARDINDLNTDCEEAVHFIEMAAQHKNIPFTYPIIEEQNRLDLKTGLYLKAYKATNPLKVVACSLSHMRAWIQCVVTDKPILVLEHDAIFVRKFNHDKINPSFGKDNLGVVGLNWAIGATRRARKYQDGVDYTKVTPGQFTVPVPSVNEPGEDPVPQGLAGNSAYYIQPWAAKALLRKTLEIGLWPNDALMCKEFFPWLKQSKIPYTELQGTKSTTTL